MSILIEGQEVSTCAKGWERQTQVEDQHNLPHIVDRDRPPKAKRDQPNLKVKTSCLVLKVETEWHRMKVEMERFKAKAETRIVGPKV